jgi:hypothetical protein
LHWSPFAHKNAQQKLFFGILEHRRHYYYWNQPLNMRMRVCYLDCHEAGLCCYLVIPIENQLHPLQLFYFHLWPYPSWHLGTECTENTVPHCSSIVAVGTCLFAKQLLSNACCISACLAVVA